MTEESKTFSAKTFLNPVFPRSFPDPFVLKFRGEYFAYCTDFWRDGRVFGVLRSRDLVSWTEIGGAMARLESDAPFYWAPEVTYSNGKFYLYYSVGNETLMELRVAVSDRPDGGFVDAGKRLTNEEFAIDAHVFTDDDGQNYLFYATDFLEHTHIGTGTVVDKMVDFFTLEGNPRPVTRARYDWQVYDPQRKEKGGVRWHTVEGPFILKRKGVYYEMFSGGNWQNITYGVSFATACDIEENEEWKQFSDGEKVLPILRTLPDLVVGPGHNSVVRGVNNRELFCVYHRWTEHGRVLSIDRMDFADSRIFIKGATYTPQTAPFSPTVGDFFDAATPDENWESFGTWENSDNETVCESAARSELICRKETPNFLCEFTLRAVEAADERSAAGFCLKNDGEKTFEFLIYPHSARAAAFWTEDGKKAKQDFTLPGDFAPAAFHLLRVECDGCLVKIKLDEAAVRFEKLLEEESSQIALVGENMRAAFSGFALTEGFEDLFDWQDSEIEDRGWQMIGEGATRIENNLLYLTERSGADTILTKGAAHREFEFAVNVRLLEKFGDLSGFGFVFFDRDLQIADRFELKSEAGNFYLMSEKNSSIVALPKNFAPENSHQFRFCMSRNKNVLQLENMILGEIFSAACKVKIGVFCNNSKIALDMARLTVL